MKSVGEYIGGTVIADGYSCQIGEELFGNDEELILPVREVSADGCAYRVGDKLFGHDVKPIAALNL